jgi:membrane protein implicated in regulation of membrane protease activity
MTSSPEPTIGSRIRALGEEILGPVPAPRGSVSRRILLVRSAFAYGGLVATLVQVVIWLMISVFAAHVDSPWWLWTAVPAAVAVAALTLAERSRSRWESTPTTR